MSRAYDLHADLVSAWTTRFGAANSTPVVGYDYTYDKAWRRDSAKLSGTAFEGELGGQTYYRYTYDGRGNLLQGFAYMGETVPDDPSDDNQTKQLSGRQFAYTYDSIGNRRSATNHGDGQPANVYTPNAVNQLDTRENHSVPVQGSAAPDATVAVTSTTNTGVVNIAAARQGRYWGAEALLANGGAENGGNGSPACAQITIVAAKAGGGTNPDKVKTVPGLALLGPALEQMTYDEDGNLTNDGLRNYYYDAENRLRLVEANETVRAFTNYTAKRVEFTYDYVGRRVAKQVTTWDRTTAQWASPVELHFVYQGWNLLAELRWNTSTSTYDLNKSYAWGLDVAASLNATGGVGALLEVVDHATSKTYLPAYDGNGNVLALLNASTGAVTNRYEYSPFGELLRDEKVAADAPANPFRWSTKSTDDETDLVYYGMRYYSPSQGRFFGRDPSGESGGLNLYGFCGNDPVNAIDALGLLTVDEYSAQLAAMTPEERRESADRAQWWAENGQGGNGGILDAAHAELDAIQRGLEKSHTMTFSPGSDTTTGFGGDSGFNSKQEAIAWAKESGSTDPAFSLSFETGRSNGDLVSYNLVDENGVVWFSAEKNSISGEWEITGSMFDVTPMFDYGSGATSLSNHVSIVAPNNTAGIPNANDTLLGQANRFIATAGGQTATDLINTAGDAAIAAQKGVVGFNNSLTGGLSGTAGVDPNDPAFRTGQTAGSATNGALLAAGTTAGLAKAGPAIGDALFARGTGLLNSNNYIRIGWGWKGSATAGSEVFRIAIGNKNSWIHWHYP